MIPEIGDALTGSGPMDEDCLRLNVWTPATGAGRRPVMVWFHGGGQRTGSGNSRLGDAMTLPSIVAVVLGGTRLAGGRGGVVGAVIGVAILTIIRNLITFANVPTWYQTLFDAVIILLALAGPGIVRLIRERRA